MGAAVSKMVAKLATNVNPLIKGLAVIMQTGGVIAAINQFSEIGHEGLNGFLTSVPTLQELAQNPSEKTLAHAKEEVDKHLGPPFADTALVGLGFVAAKGVERVAAKGSKGKNKSKESEEQSNEKQNTSDSEVESSGIEKIPPKGDFSVEGSDDNIIRKIKFDDFEEEFMVILGFMQGKHTGKADSPIKLHVMVKSPNDLGRIHEALIPALLKDPVLKANVSQWKTIDPLCGIGQKGLEGSVKPTGKGQGSKGFTIYVRSAKEALIVQKRLDNICREKGLSLPEKPNSGNCEEIVGGSNRIGISRDTFKLARDDSGRSGAGIDEIVSNRIHETFGLKPGQQLNESQLLMIEKQAGVKEGLLTYSNQGELMLRSTKGMKYNKGWYSPEAGADRYTGSLTERPALYAIYKKYGFDPADPAIISPQLGDLQ